MAAIPASTDSTTACAAVGTPAASMTSLECALEPSRRAAAALGPKHATPAVAHASARPSTSGASGPPTTSSTPASTAARARPETSPAPTSSTPASRRMPGFPGAHSTSGRWGERRSARTIACSRPPPPTTTTLIAARKVPDPVLASQRGDEVVDRDRAQRLVVRGPAGAELERDARHGLLVRRLDDRDEVEVPERGPLGLDRRAELLDLLVDLADAGRVVLDGLDALGRERGEHDVRRHGPSSLAGWRSSRPLYPILSPSCGVPEPDARTAPDPRGRRRGPARAPDRPGGDDHAPRRVLPLGRRADTRGGARP